MTRSALVNTIFSAGPDDTLAVTDVYKKKTSAIVNSFQELNNLAASTLAEAVNNKELTPEGMKSLISDVTKEIAVINPQAVIDRLVGAGTQFQSAFNQIQSEVKAGFNVVNQLANKVEATVNGLTSILKSTDISSIKGVGTLINKITDGNFNIDLVDKGALSGLVSGLVVEGNKLGLKNVFTSLTNVIQSKDILLSAVKNIIPTAIKDISLLKELAFSSIGKDLKNIVPNITSSVIGNFKIPSNIKQSSYPALFNDTMSSLNKINSNWNKTPKGSGSILNLSSALTGNLNKITNSINGVNKILSIPNNIIKSAESTINSVNKLYTASNNIVNKTMQMPLLANKLMSDFTKVTASAAAAIPIMSSLDDPTDAQLLFVAQSCQLSDVATSFEENFPTLNITTDELVIPVDADIESSDTFFA